MSLSRLCGLFCFTRQGYWKGLRSRYAAEIDAAALLNEVSLIRGEMPRCGCRKLQVLLAESGHVIGRDRLFSLLREGGMLVRRRRCRAVTTYSKHWMRKWPNLVRGLVPERPDRVWVSDITYIEVWDRGRREFLYLSLVTDAYTHEIMGHALHGNLDTEGPMRALDMAMSKVPPDALKGLIHHSDRGCQYCSAEYVSALQSHGIRISMTERGDPYENAIAERVNGILKTEWLHGMKLPRAKAAGFIDGIIATYNDRRPHGSVDMLTPAQARERSGPLKKRWKNYYRIRLESGVRGGEESPSGELPADTTEQGRRRAHIAAAVPVKISKEVVSSSMNGKPMAGQKLSNYL